MTLLSLSSQRSTAQSPENRLLSLRSLLSHLLERSLSVVKGGYVAYVAVSKNDKATVSTGCDLSDKSDISAKSDESDVSVDCAALASTVRCSNARYPGNVTTDATAQLSPDFDGRFSVALVHAGAR
jgi:hypothetical protein